MGLYSVRGTISQLGQCEFDNNLVVCAYVEIIDPTGGLSKRLRSASTFKRPCIRGWKVDFSSTRYSCPAARSSASSGVFRRPNGSWWIRSTCERALLG